jgi:signal transduction histidine kinase
MSGPRGAGASGRAGHDAMSYIEALAVTLLAFAATDLLKQHWTAPTFMLFVPAIAVAAWRGGRGPTVLAMGLSLILIDYFFIAPTGSLKFSGSMTILQITAFLLITATIAATMEALRRSRTVAESTAEKLRDVSERASKLLNVTTALSEATSLEDVTAVVLGKGLASLEAARGVLVSVDGDRIEYLGIRGYEPEVEARIRALTRDADVPIMVALRTGETVWLGSPAEYQNRYPGIYERFGAVSETQAVIATPLTHLGQAVGALSLSFNGPSAFGVVDEAFTLLLAQVTAAAIHRAANYDWEREKRKQAELLARTREAELAHVTRVTVVGEIAASIAHEVNQPLAAVVINGNAGLRWLAADPPNLEEARATLQRIIVDGNRAGDVIGRIRGLVRKGALENSTLNVNDVVRETLAVTGHELQRHRVQVHTELQEGALLVRGDRVQLQQVILNLILNAIDAMAEADRPRTLHIRSHRDDQEAVILEVTDCGRGFDPGSQGRIFEAFFSTKSTGLGMGLSVSRSIVEAHGGTLLGRANAGPGVTFYVALPASASTP